MDSINGIPALDDLDPAALVGQYSRDLRAALMAPSGGPMYVTETVVIPLVSTTSGNLYARRVGGIAFLMFEGVEPTASTITATLPAEFHPVDAPPTPNARGVIATTGTPPAVARVSVSTTVSIFGYSAGAAYYGSVSYPAI